MEGNPIAKAKLVLKARDRRDRLETATEPTEQRICLNTQQELKKQRRAAPPLVGIELR